jgi:TPR repeat protein
MAADKDPAEIKSTAAESAAVDPAHAQASVEVTESEKRKQAALQAEMASLAAVEARRAALDTAWKEMEGKSSEYERLAQEKKAQARKDAMRFFRNTVVVAIGIMLLWQVPKLVAPFMPDSTRAKLPPPAPAQSSAHRSVADARGKDDLQNGNKLFDSQDFANAVKSFRKAADQGNTKAQSTLGNMYAEGRGVTQDYQQAMSWYLKAADQGSSESQAKLGDMYAEGKGVMQDYIEAHKWFSIAGTGGDEEGKKRRETVEKAMTPAQIAEAVQRAGEWTKAHQQ